MHFVGQGSLLQVLRLPDNFYSTIVFFDPTWVSVVVRSGVIDTAMCKAIDKEAVLIIGFRIAVRTLPARFR